MEKKTIKTDAKKAVVKNKTVKKETPLKNRYSDEELVEFKQIILAKLAEAKRDFELLSDAFSNNGGEDIMDTSPTFKILEEGSQVLSKEENSKLAIRQAKFIQSLENALVRIENKTYGICRDTGTLIPKERLRVVPHATLCIESKNNQKK